MRLTILGGGGFRVPLVVRALRAPAARGLVDEVVLHDVDPQRLRAIANVVAELPGGMAGEGPVVGGTTSLDVALRGADVVFSAIRVGSAAGRVADERVALDLGVLGQETTGAGGVAYALRTLPVAVDVARRVAELAPSAWVVNFTNPAGMVTRAMGEVLGEKVIGICDSPSGLVRRAALAAGLDPAATVLPDYVGLNHLGWLRGLWSDGVDHLPALLADDGRLATFEEGRLFGPSLPRLLGALPNEYLHYYYYARESVAATRAAVATRGETLAAAQAELYPALAASPSGALERWEAARRAREEGYLAEARPAGEARDEADLAGGGYEQVALAVMRAVLTGEPAELILNVRNGSALPQLSPDAVVEVPCTVDGTGAHPHTMRALDAHQLGLVLALGAVEDATVAAATTGSRSAALRALTVHPLVDSARVAEQLLDGYVAAHPELAALLVQR
ncbi:family 4 glycosyl hydrolase [Angustibacter luteus]|uniref:6-phospho-beta-glucosidase n=1 Tax=Angustibacter luteus TaxID=658456 RepID=A0ABW1JC06_9ACTN